MFLFEHRQRALASLVLDGDFLRDLDERLLAHLDGLAVAGDAGWEVAAALAGADEPSGLFVTTAVALIAGAPRALEALDGLLLAAEWPAFAAMSWALRLWPHPVASASDRARGWLDRPEARLRAASITALTAAGGPPGGPALARALADPGADPALLQAALAGVGQTRDRQHLAAVLRWAAHPEVGADLRATALQTALLLDRREACDLARKCLGNESDRAGAARVLGIAGEASDARALAGVLAGAAPDAERAILLALGNLGWAEGVDALLDVARGDRVGARVAGFALGRILGASADWRPRAPAPSAGAATGDGDEDNGEPWTPDQELPLWQIDPVATAWQAVRARLGAGQRLRGGGALVVGAPAARSPLGMRADEEWERALVTPDAAPPDVAALCVPQPFSWRAPATGSAPATARARRA